MTGDEGLLRIGDFSRLTELSLRVLRHYDQIGLLVPARVEQATGYRWYAASQLADAHRIVALKQLGLGLAQVATVLRADSAGDEVAGMLQLERLRSVQARDEADQRIRLLDRELEELRSHGRLADLPVIVRCVERQAVLSHRRSFADLADLADAVDRVRQIRSGRGPVVVVGHDELVTDGPLDAELCLTEAGPDPVIVDDIALRPGHLPAVPTMAVVVATGDLRTEHGRALRSLGRWLGTTGHRLDGPGREVIHTAGGPGEPVIEIQYPVTPD